MAAAVKRQTAPAIVGVNFGDLGMYSGASFVPDGEYIMLFNVVNHQAKKQDGSPAGPSRLGVMVDFLPRATPTDDHKIQQFYSMGSKADLSFAPNPETGKGVVPIPGGPATGFNDKTNWYLLLKSLSDCGLSPGVFSNDVSVLDGVHVKIRNVEEPADRQTFQSNTAEVAQEQRKPGKVAIVTEILEGGAPWEGGGGLEAAAPAKAPVAKAGPKAVVKPVPVAVEEPAGEDTADIMAAAIVGVGDVLEKKPNGLPRALLKVETFKIVKAKSGEEMAANVQAQYFEAGQEEQLSNLLGELGYVVSGVQIKPAA